MSKEITLMIIITEMCNLNCSYCYEANRRQGHIKFETAKAIISKHLNDIEHYSFVDIALFGGEPFLFFDLVKSICEWTWNQQWKVKYMFSFSTNGTLLNADSKKWIKLNKDKLVLALSADGNEYSQNINRSNSFKLIDYSFFKDTFKKPLVKMTISPDTIDYLADNIIFFHERGFDFLECNFSEGIEWHFNYDLVIHELDILLNYYIEHPNVKPAPIMDFDIWKCEAGKIRKKSCGLGEYIKVFDTDGYEYPCNMLTDMSFDKETLRELLTYKFDEELLIDNDCFDNCYFYPVCKTCYIGDYLQAGKFGQKRKDRCYITGIQAWYSSKLHAKKILLYKEKYNQISKKEKQKLCATIEAIKKLNNIHQLDDYYNLFRKSS